MLLQLFYSMRFDSTQHSTNGKVHDPKFSDSAYIYEYIPHLSTNTHIFTFHVHPLFFLLFTLLMPT